MDLGERGSSVGDWEECVCVWSYGRQVMYERINKRKQTVPLKMYHKQKKILVYHTTVAPFLYETKI